MSRIVPAVRKGASSRVVTTAVESARANFPFGAPLLPRLTRLPGSIGSHGRMPFSPFRGVVPVSANALLPCASVPLRRRLYQKNTARRDCPS